MSNKALNWAWDAVIPKVGAKFVLVALADHAGDHKGEDWSCFPSVERLAEFTCQGESTVRRHLDWLVAEKWISRRRRAGRERDDPNGVYDYILHRARAAARPLELGGDQAGQLAGPALDMGGAGEGEDRSVSRPPPLSLSTTTAQIEQRSIDEPPLNPQEPTQSGCVCAPEASVEGGFERVVAAWLAAAPERCSRVKAWPKWTAACEAHPPADLERAARRYLAEAGEVARKHCRSLDRWLADGWFEAWLGEGAGSADPSPVWQGPLEVKAAVVEARGDGFAASYLDRAGWDEASRTVRPANGYARDVLRRDVGRRLAAMAVNVGEPPVGGR